MTVTQASSTEAEALRELVGALGPDDQTALLAQLRRWRAEGRPLDEVALFHASARLDTGDPAQAEVFTDLDSARAPAMTKHYPGAPRVGLPAEPLPLDAPLGAAVEGRASGRDYTQEPLGLRQLATLLRYSHGVRERMPAYNQRDFPFRFSPSAGGLQSGEVYVVAHAVEGVRRGLHHYDAGGHALELLDEGFMRHRLTTRTAYQEFIRHAAAVLVLTCVLPRMRWKYGTRSYRYAHIDTGIATQQLYLVGTALGLGVCAVAGFDDAQIDDLLRIDGHDEFSTLLVAVGRPPDLGG